ncbi:MAG: hypothetical protein AAFQ98_19790 [Bacteroidota bacterium]
MKKGLGSFLTFEFGTPKLEISKPLIRKSTPYPKIKHQSREVVIHGAFHLWILCSNWKIKLGVQQIAFDEDTDEAIQNAADYLNGQKLLSVHIDLKKTTTVFKFDLGGELTTYNEAYKAGQDMWFLYMPEKVLAFNNLGQFCLADGDAPPAEQKYEHIAVDQITINPV